MDSFTRTHTHTHAYVCMYDETTRCYPQLYSINYYLFSKLKPSPQVAVVFIYSYVFPSLMVQQFVWIYIQYVNIYVC